MKTTDHHLAALERLSKYPQLIINAGKSTPAKARRLYVHQIAFLANIYGVTATQLEQRLSARRQFI
ncbi:hypothetical protein HJC99_00685 [Candidatus Saccharibacteria bacterium]|nr:hypothetical protein [Candidatus Saccharibacteria bacterium]